VARRRHGTEDGHIHTRTTYALQRTTVRTTHTCGARATASRLCEGVSLTIAVSCLFRCVCSGFDWEEGAWGIDGNNVGSRARDLSNIMRSRAAAYRANNLLVPFGDDFKFKQAERQFSNMDRLIEHINANQATYGMRIRYSTLSDYFEAVAGSNTKFPVLTGDFFPYADNEDSYWTGYYTTRPLLKQKSRKLNHILRACEQLLVLVRSSPHSNLDTEQRNLPANYWENKFKEVERARMETALFLHHDAITGTSRTNVVQDYQNRMDAASEQLMQIMARMVEHLLTKEPNAPPALTPDALVFGPPEGNDQKDLVRRMGQQKWAASSRHCQLAHLMIRSLVLACTPLSTIPSCTTTVSVGFVARW
jgi:hypothetical protein